MTRARDLAAFVSNADGDIKFDTDTLFIDSSANNVGIGTTSPSFPSGNGLSIYSGTIPRINFKNSTTGTTSTDGGEMFMSGNTMYVQNRENAAMVFATNATTAMTINNSQNVGIGTSSPSSDLHIASTTGGTISLEDTDNGFSASTINVENGGRDLAIFAPQDIIFDQSGAETARFLDGGGLTFNGDTAAANALDDYEEGNWTASFGGAIVSPTNSTGGYVKVGKMVHFFYYTGLATVSSASGGATISGLPFTADSGSYSYTAINIAHHTIFGSATIDGYVVQNNSQISFIAGGTSGAASYSNGSKYLMVSGVYKSNA